MQVVINLSNAVKFCGRTRARRSAARAEGEACEVDVRDNGKGSVGLKDQ
jgi:K+-sensing histidine kinase KdpD